MKKVWSLVLLMLVSACVGTSLPAKFYSLKVIQAGEENAVSQVKLSIGVEEVRVSDYLDKPQIVTVKDNLVELNISEHNRWSEALATMMQRTIANDMSAYLPKSIVKARHMGRETFDYTVFVEVDKFDGALGGNAYLNAWWYVLNKDGKIMLRERVELSSPAGNNYDDLVRGESRLVAQLSRQIAEKLAK